LDDKSKKVSITKDKKTKAKPVATTGAKKASTNTKAAPKITQ